MNKIIELNQKEIEVVVGGLTYKKWGCIVTTGVVLLSALALIYSGCLTTRQNNVTNELSQQEVVNLSVLMVVLYKILCISSKKSKGP